MIRPYPTPRTQLPAFSDPEDYDTFDIRSRQENLPRRIEKWSLTSPQQRLVKWGGRLIKHARYYWLMLVESHLTRLLFGAMVWRI